MKIDFLFSAAFEYFVGIVSDLLTFVFKPRTYFAKTLAEGNINYTRRLLVYFIALELIVYSILRATVTSNHPIDYFSLPGGFILDFIIGLTLLPSFVLTSRICRLNEDARGALLYVFTFKLVYGIIPFLFYAFFLLSENYAFAMARGIATYIIAFAYIILFPLIFSASLSKRILSIFVCLSSSTLIVSAIIYAFSSSPSSFQQLKLSHPLYDPIGEEVTSAIRSIEFHEKSEQTEFSKTFWGVPAHEVPVQFSVRPEEWKAEKPIYLAELKREDSLLLAQAGSESFQTTKDLIELKRIEIQQSINLLSTIDENVGIMNEMNLKEFIADYKKDRQKFLRRPGLDEELNRLKALRTQLDKNINLELQTYSDCMKARIAYVAQANRFFDFRKRLIDLGLILP